MVTKNVALIVGIALSAEGAMAAGLERVNLDAGFLFGDDGIEISQGQVTPSFSPVSTNGLEYSKSDVANEFNVTTLSLSKRLSDKLTAGLWHTTSGNGVNIDYGTVGLALLNESGSLKADLSMPTTALMVKYDYTDQISLLGGVKRVSVSGGSLSLPLDTNANNVPDTSLSWSLGSKSGSGAVVGVAYEIKDIALRVSVLHEQDITLNVAATGITPGLTASGATLSSIGDATSVNFQTGIAKDTLIFGSVRMSNWNDNQVALPLGALAGGGFKEVSSFDDGRHYTIGIGRKFSDTLSASLSYYYSDGEGAGASELSPYGDTRTVSAGVKYSISPKADLSIGYSHSERGDATTGAVAASFTDSVVRSFGLKLSMKM